VFNSSAKFILSISLLIVFFSTDSNNLNASNNEAWSVVSYDSQELVLSYTPKLISFDTIRTADGSESLMPRLSDGYVENNTAGEPVRIMSSQMLIVPSPDGFHISDYKIGSVRKFSGLMSPVPAMRNVNETAASDFRVDLEKYNNTMTATAPVLEYAGIAGDRHLASIKLPAAYFENGKIIVPSEYLITVRFDKTAGNHTTANTGRISGQGRINFAQAKNWFVESNSVRYDDKNNPNKLLSAESKSQVKITISKEGLYSIDAGMLSDIGVSLSAADVSTVKIYGTGGVALSENADDAGANMPSEQALIVKTNADGGLKSIIFYASGSNGFKYHNKNFEHYISHFSDNNYYMLTWGGAPGKRASAIAPPDGDVVNKPSLYTFRLFKEEEVVNAFRIGSGRQWFGRSLFPATFTDELTGLVQGKEVLYKVKLAHRASHSAHFNINQGSTSIGTMSVSGMNLSYYKDAVRSLFTQTIPTSDIANSRSVLRFEYDNPSDGSGAIPFFDWYEIHYPRSLAADDNSIWFFDDTDLPGMTEYNIGGFSNEVYGFDVTDRRNPQLLTNLGSSGYFKFKSFQEESAPNRYFISSKLLKPSLTGITIPGLKTDLDGANVILITHKDLKGSAEAYKEYRDSRGELTVKIAYTEDIFNEFGAGISDPTALRDYVAYAFDKWTVKPRYVILWGDGHYDYRQIETKGSNYVFPYESLDDMTTFDAIKSYTSDNFYVCVKGNDRIADLAIGRVPVTSSKVGYQMVEKIKHYESSSDEGVWRTRLTLMADDSPTSKDSDGTLHTSDSEELSKSHVIDDLQQKKIYLPEFPTENIAGGKRKPGVTQEFINTVNINGSLIVGWIGHGNPRVLAHEEIFERSLTIPQLLNYDKLFFMTAATCDFGRFDLTETQSGAEELVLSNIGGAIGIFTATRVVWAGSNAIINKAFYDMMFTRESESGEYMRIGDVACEVKQDYYGLNDRKFNILGDPTVRILLPANNIVIDEINGLDPGSSSSTITLKALSTVIITGRVMKLNTETHDSDFNGTVVVSMFDSDQELRVKDTDNTIHSISKFGGALTRSSFKVENGSFTAEFIIPKDISFSNEPGRIFAYAYTDDKSKYAKGSTNNFTVGGIALTHIQDDEGPEISLFMDSRLFESDDYVQPNPKLIVDMIDESGINTTGLGIGHKIEVWIDDNPQSIDLTEKFTTSSTNYGAGSVEEILYDIAPGRHKIKVRAWDIFNNYSVAETYFRIADNKIVIEDFYCCPNPFQDEAVFRFVHNAAVPFTAELTIYTAHGALVKTINTDISTAHNSEIPWDGYNDQGQKVASGTYLYQISITDRDGVQSRAGGVMAITK
jgi:hypothetical protein